MPRTVVVSWANSGLLQNIEIGPHRLLADEPANDAPGDSGPNPYELLLSALGACTGMTLRLYAERKQWPLEDVEVRLTHSRIYAEDCADCETKVGMLDHIQMEISLIGDLSEEQRARLMYIADRCPVHRTLTSEVKIETRLTS